MKVNLGRVGILSLIIIEAVVVLISTREPLVLLMLGLMLIAGLLLKDGGEWGFLTFIAAIPLIVTAGELYLPAGGILLVTSLGLLFLDSYQYWNRNDHTLAILLSFAILSATNISPVFGGISGMVGIFILIAVSGSMLVLFRNRILKRYYMGDKG
jgi:hypothetical protein